jgi:CobQ-like glutamine amidotransferase family enzyme
LQILGTSFVGADGAEAEGLALLDCRTARSTSASAKRAVGELVVDPDRALGLPPLSGYENHGSVTTVGPAAAPIGRVRSGVGNGDGTDGAWAGRVLGTYLHGPVLARNPALADLMLAWVVGSLQPLDDVDSEELRSERLRAAPAEASEGSESRLGPTGRLGGWLGKTGSRLGRAGRRAPDAFGRR